MEEQSIVHTNNKPISSIARKYSSYKDFLDDHAIKKNVHNTNTNPKPITNTRIGDESTKIYGGSYSISEQEYPTFLQLYHKDIIEPKKKEYLTEKQLETGGPILVDLDFKHDYDIDERQYNKDQIEDLIDGYLEEFKNIYQLDEQTRFQIFVFEKPTVNRVHDKKITKDGIHMIICVQADHTTQRLLRQRMLLRAPEIFKGFPIKNSWDDVFDEGISIGFTNWQLYGSRKPNHERYQLTHVYEVSYDTTDGEFMRPELSISSFDIGKNIQRLSVRYKDHISLFMKNSFVSEHDDFNRINRIGQTGSGHTSGHIPSNASIARQNQLELLTGDICIVSRIQNAQDLDLLLNNFLDGINSSEYNLKDAYDYTMILPETYYGLGSYSKWIRVGWALRNTSNKLLIVWIAFSAKYSGFDYSKIPDMCEQWRTFDNHKDGRDKVGRQGLTKLSLMHWAKSDAKEAFETVRYNSIDYFVELTINAPSSSRKEDRTGCGDCDLAHVIYQMKKHEFVCVSISSNIWYQYKNHRWQKIDSGTSLRFAISEEMRPLYFAKSFGLTPQTDSVNGQQLTEAQDEQIKAKTFRIMSIGERLGRSNDKDHIMKEAKELFYDGEFFDKLDTNPKLLCFKNGVFDFSDGVRCFRKGHPEDAISMCTNIDYIPLDPVKHKVLIDEINDFMNKLFPEKELCEYMWDHLASTLIGTSVNQTFNNYIGNGQNGKSVLVNLMEIVLGEYKGDVPLTLVTDKRGKVGGLAPELVQLKGKRYAVMQEPSKGDKINEGIMKQLTSGKDQIQCRAPYMIEAMSFLPQFTLVVTCNNLMEIKSNDHGTWRRIRAVPFKSLFTENPIHDDPDKPYQFLLDPCIDEKFDSWKEVFMSMLVERSLITNGFVKDCSIVTARSNEYRKSQDYISEFIYDRVVRDVNGRVKKMELNNDFSMWYAANYGGRGPGPKDLHEYMDKEFGRQRNQVWTGIKIRYDKNEYSDDVNEYNEDINADDL